MRILACLGISDSFGRAFKDTMSQNEKIFDQYGIQFATGVSIMKGITTGDRMRENRVAQVTELNPKRQELDVLCLRNPSLFCKPSLMIGSDGALLPNSELMASYLNHALANFQLDIVLSIEPVPLYARKNKEELFRRNLDTLSRSELIQLSWRDQVIEICRNLPNARIHLVSDYAMPTIFPDLLAYTLPQFTETDLVTDGKQFNKITGVMGKFAEPVDKLLASRASPEDKANMFIDIFSEGLTASYLSAISEDISIHENIVMELIVAYFADIEFLTDMEIENLDTTFLG